MSYQVVWARCNVFDTQGSVTTLYRGDFVPASIDDLQKSQLATIGATRFVDSSLPPLPESAVAVQAAPLATDADDDDADADPVPLTGDMTGSNPDDDEEDGEKPAKSDSKAEWEEYAVSQGMLGDDAHAATKADLIARFG
jgi:hypothetical protein